MSEDCIQTPYRRSSQLCGGTRSLWVICSVEGANQNPWNLKEKEQQEKANMTMSVSGVENMDNKEWLVNDTGGLSRPKEGTNLRVRLVECSLAHTVCGTEIICEVMFVSPPSIRSQRWCKWNARRNVNIVTIQNGLGTEFAMREARCRPVGNTIFGVVECQAVPALPKSETCCFAFLQSLFYGLPPP
jgi:hypothetical protein